MIFLLKMLSANYRMRRREVLRWRGISRTRRGLLRAVVAFGNCEDFDSPEYQDAVRGIFGLPETTR